MSDPNAKSGPLTQADLQATWESAVDETFSQPFIEAGEGQGFEAYTQAFAQFARVSRAIDVTTQAMFVRAWSGQSNPPAAGGAKATVTLSFKRTSFIDRPLRLQAGLIFVQEQEIDWGDGGGVEVLTGRRFVLTEDVIFLPGEVGPLTGDAEAENIGYGYNNPQPDSISVITQEGSGFTHNLATVAVQAGALPPSPTLVVTLTAFNEADMFIPQHVGQYVQFTAGVNTGITARVISFASPSLPNGSAVTLEQLVVAQAPSITGTFQLGEQVVIKNGVTPVGYATFLLTRADGNGQKRIAMILLSGSFAIGNTLTGAMSGATATINQNLYQPAFTPEAPVGGTGSATWRVLDWVLDFGVTVSHAAQPSGGRAAMLDELGNEKNLPRAPGENDSTYAYRQSKIADVVSPNAIKRTLNKVMGLLPWCFREVGSALLPGFYYDRVDAGGDAYDGDVIVTTGTVASGVFLNPATQFQEPVEYRNASNVVLARGYFGRIDGGVKLTMIRLSGYGSLSLPLPFNAGDYIIGLKSGAIWNATALVSTPSVAATRFHLYLDYTDFRAMFMVGVPRQNTGEFGFAYDAGPYGGYDTAPYPDFYDGFAVGTSVLLQQIYTSIDRIRAGGVSWYLYLEDGTCS